jgi:chemotaxis protein methyltransferase WspC
MAIALLDKGVSSHLFAVDAVDISRRSLALAAGRVYGKNSFRGRDLAFRDRHFARDGHRYRLSDAARARVSFEPANLFDPLFKSRALYDVIFCRNLLIYFDAATQAEAVRILSGLLRPDGALFVGPSEASLLLSLQFQPARIPLAFAFFKGTPAAVARAPASLRPSSPRPVKPPAAPRAIAPSPPPDRVPDPPLAAAAPSGLAEVHRLAEQGHLVEAARLCQAYLKGKAASAEAVFLLGVIRDAAGNLEEAADLYRKAIYLNPADDLALAHLALVLERSGDVAGAEAANDRLRRFERRGRG